MQVETSDEGSLSAQASGHHCFVHQQAAGKEGCCWASRRPSPATAGLRLGHPAQLAPVPKPGTMQATCGTAQLTSRCPSCALAGPASGASRCVQSLHPRLLPMQVLRLCGDSCGEGSLPQHTAQQRQGAASGAWGPDGACRRRMCGAFPHLPPAARVAGRRPHVAAHPPVLGACVQVYAKGKQRMRTGGNSRMTQQMQNQQQVRGLQGRPWVAAIVAAAAVAACCTWAHRLPSRLRWALRLPLLCHRPCAGRLADSHVKWLLACSAPALLLSPL